MRKCFKLYLIIITVFLQSDRLMATHASGVDLTYDCLGDGEYEFFLTFYWDCLGQVGPPVDPMIFIQSDLCSFSFNETLTLNPMTSDIEAEQLCDDVSSTCDNPSSSVAYPGFKIYEYSGIVTLPLECSDWYISFSECCRNTQISNVNNADTYNMYVRAYLNNENGLCNSSPKFSSEPLKYWCLQYDNFYYHGAINLDGNPMSYSLVNPLDGNAFPITDYVSGISSTQPIPVSSPSDFLFEPANGQILFDPSELGVNVYAVLVEEFDDDGNLIASVTRDMEAVILDCGKPKGILSGGIQNLNLNPIHLLDSVTVSLCPGTFLEFDLIGLDTEPDDSLTITSNLDISIPGATFTQVGTSSNPSTYHFTWTPDVSDIGIHTFAVYVQDTDCPFNSINSYGITINVLDNTNAGEDLYYCSIGEPAVLTVENGTSFSWSSNQSDPGILYESTNSDTLIVAPSQDTEYYVSSNLINGCSNMDTVSVFVIPDYTYSLTQDTTLCIFEEIVLEVAADPAYGPYTYSWSPDLYLSSTTSAMPISSGLTDITYTVTVTSAAGCQITDSVSLTTSGVLTTSTLSPLDTIVCPGDSVQLSAVVTNIGELQYEIGDSSLGGLSSPFDNFWEDGRVQMLWRNDELIDIGMFDGLITELAFFVPEVSSTVPYEDFTISYVLSSNDSMTVNWETGLQTIYGPYDYSVIQGWNVFALDTAILYDTNFNLVLQTCFNNSSWTSTDKVTTNQTSFPSVVYGNVDGSDGCIIVPEAIEYYRPDLRFTLGSGVNSDLLNAYWTPSSSLSATDINDPIAIPFSTTTYEFISDVGGCINVESITVYVSNDTSECDIISGINSLTTNYDFSLMPNPAKENLYVHFEEKVTTRLHYEVHDISGKPLLSSVLKIDGSIDISNLESGIYFLKLLKSGKHYGIKKFIKE